MCLKTELELRPLVTRTSVSVLRTWGNNYKAISAQRLIFVLSPAQGLFTILSLNSLSAPSLMWSSFTLSKYWFKTSPLWHIRSICVTSAPKLRPPLVILAQLHHILSDVMSRELVQPVFSPPGFRLYTTPCCAFTSVSEKHFICAAGF